MPIKKSNRIIMGCAITLMVVVAIIPDCASKNDRAALLKAVHDKYAVMVGKPISAISVSSLSCSRGDSGRWAEARVCVRSGSNFHEFIAKIGAPLNTAPVQTTVSDPNEALVCFGWL